MLMRVEAFALIRLLTMSLEARFTRLLAKSVCQLEIADPRDQAEAQAEATPAVAVSLRKYAKPLHEAYRVLVTRAGAGKLAVPALVLRAQRALLRQIAVAVQLSHALGIAD